MNAPTFNTPFSARAAARLGVSPPTELPFDIRAAHAAANVLFVLAAVLVLALGTLAIMRLPMFTLRSISVDGDLARNSVATLRANAIKHMAGNFFTISLARSKQAFESVPWVRSAVVRRVWPNRLAVTLEEHHAAAYWEQINGVSEKLNPAERSGNPTDELEPRLVNSVGEVFEANLGDVEDERLPTLEGPSGQAAAMLTMLRRLQSVFEPMQANIETLHLSERGSWAVTLEDGAQIELGRGAVDDVLARTQRFASTLVQVTSQYRVPLQYADLRYPQGYAVQLRGMSILPAASRPQPNQ